jgi:hypothetical protein
MGKRRPEDILGDIEASGAEEAADRALAMPAEKRAAELEAAGVTQAEAVAAGDAWHERMQRVANDEARRRAEVVAREAVVRPTRRPPWGVLVAAAVAVVVALFFMRQGGPETPVAVPTATGTPTNQPGSGVAFEAGVIHAAMTDAAANSSRPLPERPRLK